MYLLAVFSLIIVLGFLDLSVCCLYCKKKKKIDRNRIEKTDESGTDEEEVHEEQMFVHKVKMLLHGWIMYRLQVLGRFPSQKYRLFLLKNVFQMDIGKNVVFYHWDTIRAPWNISIGEGSVIGDRVILDGRNGIKIGSKVNISTAVSIYTEQHDINDPFFRSLDSGGRVVIENRVWLSSHTAILPNVRAAEGSVLAANALATKDLDAFGVYGGVPAKKIGNRSSDLQYQFDGEFIPFF